MRRLHTQREQRRRIALAVRSSPHGILAPLNLVTQSKRTQQLITLVRTLQEIERVEGVFAEVDRQLRQGANYVSVGPERAPSRLYAQANEILSVCHWSPCVAPLPNELNSFKWEARTRESEWNNKFVHWVLKLRAQGDISRIRNCRNCGQWFYAVTDHQAFCDDRCRQQFHSRDKRFKEKRRLYMRRYRKQEKSQDLKAAQMVKRGSSQAGARKMRDQDARLGKGPGRT